MKPVIVWKPFSIRTHIMKRAVKIPLLIVALVIVAGGAAFIFGTGEAAPTEEPHVTVARGSLVDKALAVGTIEPRVQVSVKSQLSGVVSRQFAEPGEFVRAGAPLLEIRPTPTPQEIVDAERQVDLRRLELTTVEREHERQKALVDKALVSAQDYELVRRRLDEAALQLQMSEERLELLRSGRISKTSEIATVVTAPITGFVLDKNVEIGDPVVPLTSFQEGTVLMTMADMDDLIFRGTVDEIDVGKLIEGMPADIRVGALPGADVNGQLSRIWLKARKEDNSTVFPVEVDLESAFAASNGGVAEEGGLSLEPAVLRAGYSANAEIIVARRDSVLTIPERVITFEDGHATVEILHPDNRKERVEIETGLSDAIHIEVLAGLGEGDRVAEKPLRTIN